MAANGVPPGTSLEEVMSQLQAIQHKQDELLAVVDSMSHAAVGPTAPGLHPSPLHKGPGSEDVAPAKSPADTPLRPADASPLGTTSPTVSGFTSRIVLT